MSFEQNIKERIQKLIEEKTTEIQRTNNAKLEAVKIKLKRMLEIEEHLCSIASIMNEQLTPYNKVIKVKGNTEELLKDVDNLDPLDAEMKIPNKELKIGIGYVNAKNPITPAYAKAVVVSTLGADKVSASLNDTVIWTFDIINISNDMMTELIFKMIEGAKW